MGASSTTSLPSRPPRCCATAGGDHGVRRARRPFDAAPAACGRRRAGSTSSASTPTTTTGSCCPFAIDRTHRRGGRPRSRRRSSRCGPRSPASEARCRPRRPAPGTRSRAGRPTSPAWCGRCATRAGHRRPRRRPAGRRSTCRSAPDCPRRPRWSARSRSALPTWPASDSTARPWPRLAPARRERLRRRADAASWTSRRRMLGEAGHAMFLDCRSLRRRAGPARTSTPPGCACSSSTPWPRTSYVDGGYAQPPARPARRPPRRSACPRCATRHVTISSASTTPTTDAPPRPSRRHRERTGARGRRSAAASWARGASARRSTRRTPRCATISRSAPTSSTSRSRRALASGALGARMTGGGFGGSAIVLAEGAAVDEITERVEAAFSRHGFRRPSGHTVTPARGAGRL